MKMGVFEEKGTAPRHFRVPRNGAGCGPFYFPAWKNASAHRLNHFGGKKNHWPDTPNYFGGCARRCRFAGQWRRGGSGGGMN